jgi:hypothetical protein
MLPSLLCHPIKLLRESCAALSELSVSQGEDEVAASGQPAAQAAAASLMAVDAAQVGVSVIRVCGVCKCGTLFT